MAFPKRFNIFRGPAPLVVRPRQHTGTAPRHIAVPTTRVPAVNATTISNGVQFHAPWALYGNGICTVWRRMARALADTGTPVQLTLDNFYGPAQPLALAEVADLINKTATPGVFVGGFPTSGDLSHAAKINELNTRFPIVVLTSMIERDRIGPLAVKAANRVHQWWLPCDANIQAFLNSGVDAHRLHKVHVPFFPNDQHLSLVNRTRDPGPTRFYQIGVLDQRKDQSKLLLCFLSAFRRGEAELTIKTTHLGVDLQQLCQITLQDEQVRANGWTEISTSQGVSIVNEVWPEDRLLDLHRRGDVYVTLSHGEGWEMSAYDALLSGNRMVYTASGGPQEFAAEGDLLVPTTRNPLCDPFYRWEPDARWIDCDRADVVRQLRAAHENPLPKEHRRSWAGFTSADVGALMRRLLEEARQEMPSRLSPRHPPNSNIKNSLVIVSLFRQCPDAVRRYRSQIESLHWTGPLHVVCIEGDSTDQTPEILDEWARQDSRVTVLHHDLGNPLFGSTLNPVRLQTLAEVSNVGLDHVARNLDTEYVLFLTSDLLIEPDLATRLQRALEGAPEAERPGVVAPMVWRDTGTGDNFYDTWAFRRRVKNRDALFEESPSRNKVLSQLGSCLQRMESVGSVLFCRAALVYAGVRFTPDMDVIGFCSGVRRVGYSIWADPSTHVRHPKQVNTVEVRATVVGAETIEAARLTLMRRWMGRDDSNTLRDLSQFSLRELVLGARQGPSTPDETIRSGRTGILIIYCPNQVPHGVASHVMNIRREHPNCSWVRTLGEALRVAEEAPVSSVILELQWGNAPLAAQEVDVVRRLRSKNVRIIVDYHHAERSTEWLQNLKSYTSVADQLVFYHPEAIEIAGTGVYHPLPVPKFEIVEHAHVGGIVFTGFADPSRCIDKIVEVGERIGQHVYGYGCRVDRVHEWYDTRGWTQFRPMRAYLDESEWISELSRHSIALLARSPSSKAYSSASARFCMAAGLPVVVDRSRSYEDLQGHVAATVSYKDKQQVDAEVNRLLHDRAYRAEALARQTIYAERTSVSSLLVEMGVA